LLIANKQRLVSQLTECVTAHSIFYPTVQLVFHLFEYRVIVKVFINFFTCPLFISTEECKLILAMENCWKRNQLSILNENFGVSNVRDVVYLAMFEKIESEGNIKQKKWKMFLPSSTSRKKNIQGVSEIRVLILTSRKTSQFMKLFSIIFCKIRKRFPRFFAPQFLPN
jgi:hypothetical protein